MAQKKIKIGVEVDRETDLEIEEWSDREGRSKRRHLAILTRKLTELRRNHPGELERLGLLERSAFAGSN